MIGGGGSGKSTLRRNFGGEVLEEVRYRTEEGKRFYVTYFSNSALAGNKGTGTDGNSAPDLIKKSAREAFKHRDIVMFDGVMGSPRTPEIPNEMDECVVILVIFNITHEEGVKRLMARRRSRGVIEDKLPDKTFYNSKVFYRRAELTYKHFQEKCQKEMIEINIYNEDDAQTVLEKVKKEVENVRLR